MDTRINCTELAPENERYMICLYPKEPCEMTVHPEELGWGEVKISISKGSLAVAFSTPVQFIWELLCIYLIKIRHNKEKASESCKMLSFQIFMVLFYLYLVAQVTHDLYLTLSFGRPGVIFTTFFFCLFLDQLKSVCSMGLIYCIVVRRFMYLDINENDFID
jgi:uncharacterized membrane protein YozB (DUF420 family)